jgi:hypothetical protein
MPEAEGSSLAVSPDLVNSMKTLGKIRAMFRAMFRDGLTFGEIAKRLNAAAPRIGPDESGRSWTLDDVREVCDTLPRAAKAPRNGASA